jgi:stage V sporulation protein G
MNVTEAKVKLVSDKADKLKAFCTITVDGEFVIRDIKVIKGTRGYFVAMPSRKLMDRCPSCGGKNHLRAVYCNECGGSLRTDRVPHDPDGRAKLHADIAHPINQSCRNRLQQSIIDAYEAEVERSKQPGYIPVSDDDLYDEDDYPASDADDPDAGPEAPGSLDESDKSDESGAEERVAAAAARPAQQTAAAEPPVPPPDPQPPEDSFGQGIF